MLTGNGSLEVTMSEQQVGDILAQSLAALPVDGKRVLVIIPDSTRTAPIPMMFRLLYKQLAERVACLDYLIALGTHMAMSEEAITRLVGASAEERAANYPKSTVYNHHWDDPQALHQIGLISAKETDLLTNGLFAAEVPVVLNRMILDYDHLMICGPVFPHEVAGFSGGAKYFFPGIAGADIINFTHWLGALVTSMHTIGVKDTPVRRVIHHAASYIPRPISCISMVLKGSDLHGVYAGPHEAAWSAASDLSKALNIRSMPHSFKSVLSMPSHIYDDLWTAAKAMYKTEPSIADGGEVIIYAPHITEVSYTHGHIIDEVGYHVRDYFLKQWERFKHIPGGILAHSTHVKGQGSYDADTGLETPRIRVTLATSIPEARCKQINMGYLDYHSINPDDWAMREDQGLLLVPHAGEVLFRCEELLD